MHGELVSVLTEDRVRLDGFIVRSGFASQPQNSLHNVQAAVLVHGLSGNFYQSSLLRQFANELANNGVVPLLINTRGHDYLNSTTRMGRATTLGAAVEVVDECRFDLYAWCQFLVDRGFDQILLLGHSLGSIKILYSQAHLPHPCVTRLAAYSPTKLSYNSLLGSTGGARFSHWIMQCQQAVAENRGDDLMFVDFPFPTWMSAHAYLNKYSHPDRYNWLTFREQISIPVAAIFGEREMEENPAFQAMKPDLAKLNQPNFTIHFIPHADHFYSACIPAASKFLFEWLHSHDQALDRN
jgi:hypothetical protein